VNLFVTAKLCSFAVYRTYDT